MGTFKHCGRLRSARLIGRDLSRFYLELGQPQKSVSFLLDLLRGYQEENWPLLKIDTHIELAEVYQKLGDRIRYVASNCVFVWLMILIKTCCSTDLWKRRQVLQHTLH